MRPCLLRRLLRPAILAALLTGPAAALAVPSIVPVQGVLQDTDGAAITGELPVRFDVYADPDGEALVWTESRPVAFERGFFSVDLGDLEPLDAGLFRDHPDGLWLAIAVDGDDAMPPIALGTAPYAAFAAHAGDAETVGGLAPDAFAAAEHRHRFDALDAIPPGLLDGDDDTTYAAGHGLVLDGGAFALRPCADGQVLASAPAGWVCADGDALSPAVAAELVGTTLIITDGAAISEVDLAALGGGDDDGDPTNELLVSAALDGATLVLTDAGGEARVDLSALVPASGLSVTAAALDGSTLVLARGADPADALTVDLGPLAPEDGDTDDGNELLQGGLLDGTLLSLVDAGGVLSIDLAPLLAGDDDGDRSNELLAGAVLNGTTLELRDAGGLTAVDLAALVADGDADDRNELLRSATLDGTRLALTDAGGTTTVELGGLVGGDVDPSNELLTSAALDGTTLILGEGDAETTVDLAALVADDDADARNELLTGAALVGTTLSLEDAGGERRIELASLIDDDDADPTNELQSLVFSPRTGVLSLTGTNAVDVFEGAFVLSANVGAPVGAGEGSIDGDDVGQSVELPFSVSYGGVAYTHVWIETNGFFELQTAPANLGSDAGNSALPSGDHAGPFAAIYWDDLITTASWTSTGEAPSRVFTVEWDGTTLIGRNAVRFSARIHEGSGVITARYHVMAANARGQRATIGFQTAGAGGAKAYPIGLNAEVLGDPAASAQSWSVAPLR